MEFNPEIRRELDRACVCRNVRKLALFGSAADGDFDTKKSDLDFAVEFAPMPPVEHKRAYFGLFSDLEALFGRSVDLVELTSVENPFIRESIEARQKVVYAAA